MEKIRLSDGTVINISAIELAGGALKISTPEHTVEELVAMFSDKSRTSLITILTESGEESGQKIGFTSLASITYGADGTKTVELFQPVDVTEARVSNAEGAANAASKTAQDASGAAQAANEAAQAASEAAQVAKEAAAVLSVTLDSILTDVIPNLMA